jgi:hypothetical protein
MARVCERTIPTKQLPLVGKVNAKFADRGCHVVSMMDPYGCILGFSDQSRYFFFQAAPQLYSREWTLFQTRNFSGNLVVPGIKPRPLDL